MTETCAHPKGALVVPEKVVPAFAGSLLPRETSSSLKERKTLLGRLHILGCKASAIASPILAIGSLQGYMAISEAIPNPDLVTLLGVTCSSLGLMVIGGLGTVISFSSLMEGDRKYFPLPPSKKYLAQEASKQKAMIAPFEDWDNIFDKNSKTLEG